MPERIDVEMHLPEGETRLEDTPPLRVEARYLFGAPGADLPVEGEVQLRALKDHDNPDLSELHVALDSRTLLLVRS